MLGYFSYFFGLNESKTSEVRSKHWWTFFIADTLLANMKLGANMQTLMKIAKQTSVPVFQVSTKVPVSNVSLLSHYLTWIFCTSMSIVSYFPKVHKWLPLRKVPTLVQTLYCTPYCTLLNKWIDKYRVLVEYNPKNMFTHCNLSYTICILAYVIE
jgi:hypothetical protein